jgi:hypothetical protein
MRTSKYHISKGREDCYYYCMVSGLRGILGYCPIKLAQPDMQLLNNIETFRSRKLRIAGKGVHLNRNTDSKRL